MPTYTWVNKQTGEKLDIVCKIADRDIPPALDGDWERELASPMVLKASFLDGQRARSDSNFQKIKEAANLKVAQANTDNKAERATIQKTIDKLEKL